MVYLRLRVQAEHAGRILEVLLQVDDGHVEVVAQLALHAQPRERAADHHDRWLGRRRGGQERCNRTARSQRCAKGAVVLAHGPREADADGERAVEHAEEHNRRGHRHAHEAEPHAAPGQAQGQGQGQGQGLGLGLGLG